ncbi:hypothetical protein EVU91_13085 [Macrococcoides bohemicum]|uniref:hypothetical protein n=1 Tax=Macrococcoides bohemicum TaxID=1903056 RepID=UPI00105963FD|nr:hypothetical protein [Macrococcus bohemicus]TDL33510.1 hypothetical protein EVU91_13085 [Macrococcus bohemicus]
MANDIERYSIWQLKNTNLNFEEIQVLLKENYNKVINFINNKDELEEHEYTLNNKWIDKNGSNIFEVETFINPTTQLETEFIFARGFYESSSGIEKSYVNGKLLPRETRIFNHSFEACFFKMKDNFYVALKCNKTESSRIRSSLLKFKRENADKNLWGSIIYNEPLNYKLDSNFFYWLIYKKYKKGDIKISHNSLKVLDISRTIQNLNTYVTHNMGEDLLSSTSALSGFGENHIINEAGAMLVSNQMVIALILTKDGVIYLDKTESNLPDLDGFKETSLYLYSYLLPELLKTYSLEFNSEDKTQELISDARKEWALNAIINLCDSNSILIEEIEEKLESNE